jgi:hypothetical protein
MVGRLLNSVGVAGLLLIVAGATITTACGPCDKMLVIDLTLTEIDDAGGTVTVYARGTKIDTPPTGYTLDATVEKKDGDGFWRPVDSRYAEWQDEYIGDGDPECAYDREWAMEAEIPEVEIAPGDRIRVHVSVTGFVPMGGTEYYSPELVYE